MRCFQRRLLRVRRRPAEEDRSIRSLHEPIVSDELFDRVQDMRTWRARVVKPGPRAEDYLRRKLLHLRALRCAAGWWEYADAVVQGVGDRSDVVVVGHSLGGFTAPLACLRIPVDLLVLVAAMIPSPGELFADWWANTGYEESGYDDVFYHDLPPELAAEARRRERDEAARALREPWPLEAWPDTPARYLLCRDDRMFPAGWARRHACERLGIDADEMDGGHYISLSRPRELAGRLVAYAAGTG